MGDAAPFGRRLCFFSWLTQFFFGSGLYMPLIMVAALRPKTLNTMDVRSREMTQ